MIRPVQPLVIVATLAAVAAACGSSPAEPAGIASIEIVTTTTTTTTAAEGGASDGSASSAEDPVSTGPTASYSIVAQAVTGEVTARTEPDPDGAVVATLANPTASGAPLVFRAVDGGPSAPGWIQVHLPIQPNGTTGWIEQEAVSLSNNPYRIEIERASYRLRVYELDQLVTETEVAIGTGATPTPVGEFYLLELLAPPDPDGPYGPFAFGLSGFSEVLDSFGGADEAIIGLHGTNDPSSLGTDVSHGCIRLDNDVITDLAAILPLGTPVLIT